MEELTEHQIRDILISKIGNATNKEKVQLIMENFMYINDIDFICVDNEKGHNIFKELFKMFNIKNEDLFTPFTSKFIRVLNYEFLIEEKTNFTYLFDIGLDTQIISYINRYQKDNLEQHLTNRIEWLHIKRDIASIINLDAYINENYIKDEKFSPIFKENIYNFFYYLNQPLMNEKKAKKEAKKQIKLISKNEKYFKELSSIFKNRYYNIYCMLLKIIILNYSNLPLKNKLLDFINFQNIELATQDISSINIAIKYWKNNKSLTFFGKIIPHQKNILAVIKNMAWDICHWTNTILNFNPKIYNQSDIYMPLFFTIDKKFKELIHSMKTTCIAIDKSRGICFPFYDNSLIKKELSEIEIQKYFNLQSYLLREEKRNTINKIKLSKSLEEELLKINEFN